ncbi:hypothetical protein [Spirosoma validum]|uniref:hypothetical protein n=1 Tax=Spirosoma validum TaxID=2771355 RepID=UPI001CC2AAD8|nr:hypothetical protein [Spirosoma validum]
MAQQLAVDAYWVKIVTTEGNRFSGVLSDIDNSHLYLTQERNTWRTDDGRIPIDRIRKVAIRRKNQTPAVITGAVLGGLLVGYLANQSLRTNQTRSPVSHGLTLTFAIAGGAAGGVVIGSAVGRLTRRVIRPLQLVDPATFLLRQLEPFSVRYQQDFMYRLPKPLQ